jgi:hypothetical protein
MKPSHIFVVGLPRSGTTLLRYVLNSSGEIAICGETHFFGSPRLKSYITGKFLPGNEHPYNQSIQGHGRKVINLIEEGGKSCEIVDRIADYLFSINGHYWRWFQDNMSREEFEKRLGVLDLTAKNVLDLLLTIYAKEGQIVGEKTPAHLYYVPTLLDWFPGAKAIHIIRDPRAVYVSHRRFIDLRTKSQSYGLRRRIVSKVKIILLFYVTFSWARAVSLHRVYSRMFSDRYYLCKFEDLILSPTTQIQDICHFLEMDFSKSMLQPVFHNSSFISWDEQMSGFEISAVDRWRKQLHPLLNRWIVTWTRGTLLEMGYEI